MYQNCKPEDALALSMAMGRDFPLGEHFKLWEMQCNDGDDAVLVHPALIVLLNDLRRHFKASVNINSGYRTELYNEEIGGGSNSRHMLGMAADVTVFNVSPEEVVKWAAGYDVGGIGRYNSFTHIDVELRRDWDNR